MSILSDLRRLLGPPDRQAPERSAPGPTRGEARMRRDAEAILRAAVEAADPQALVAGALTGLRRAIPGDARVYVVGFGTAAAAMARGAESALGSQIAEGVLVVPASSRADAPAGFDTFGGGCPIPDPACEAGARSIRQLASELSENDLLLCLISGGGSSLLTLPPDGMPLEEIVEVTQLLLDAGATRREINLVRRHLDLIKGGRLARAAAPARVIAMVLSDIAGDPPEQIASGPLSPERSRPADAVTVLKRYGLWKQVPLAARGWLDRGISRELEPAPGRDDPCFKNVELHVVGNGHTAARTACSVAENQGYEAQVITAALGGEARKAGAFLAAAARSLARSRSSGSVGKPACIIACGDTDPATKEPGTGGPNQELVLAAVLDLEPLDPFLIAAMSTSGIDGPTGAAGAIATGTTLRRAEAAGLDCRDTVRGGNANLLFSALDDLIVSGPTGTSVGDIRIILLD